MARADKFTGELKKIELYSDFPINFDRNPITGLLAKVSNEDSVKQSLKQLVLTNVGERFYDSNKGSRISGSLFEPASPTTLEIIRTQIKECIGAYEPRCQLLEVNVQDIDPSSMPFGFTDLDKNSLMVDIVFSIINIPDRSFNLTFNVKRVR